MKNLKPCMYLPTELLKPYLIRFLYSIPGLFRWEDGEDEVVRIVARRPDILELFLERLIESLYLNLNKDFDGFYAITKVRPLQYENNAVLDDLAKKLKGPFFRPNTLYSGEIIRVSDDQYLFKIIEDGDAWREAYLKESRRREELEKELEALGKQVEENEELVRRVTTLEIENDTLFSDLKKYKEELGYGGLWKEGR